MTAADVTKINDKFAQPVVPTFFGKTKSPVVADSSDHTTQDLNSKHPSPPRVALDFDTLAKHVEEHKEFRADVWTPPSSQKRKFFDSIQDFPPRVDQPDSPTRSTLRMPSASPLKRNFISPLSKRRRDDPFAIEKEDEETIVTNSQPIDDKNTMDLSRPLTDTEWDRVNRRQPVDFDLAYDGGEERYPNSALLRGHDGTLHGKQRSRVMSTKLERALSPNSARYGPRQRVSFAQEDGERVKLQGMIDKAPCENGSYPQQSELSEQNQERFLKGDYEEVNHKRRKLSEALPSADLTDSIRTAY